MAAKDIDPDARVLKSVKSRGFRGPLWCEQEDRLRHFHRELDRYINNEKSRRRTAYA